MLSIWNEAQGIMFATSSNKGIDNLPQNLVPIYRNAIRSPIDNFYLL
jgi:hypothetical protein